MCFEVLSLSGFTHGRINITLFVFGTNGTVNRDIPSLLNRFCTLGIFNQLPRLLKWGINPPRGGAVAVGVNCSGLVLVKKRNQQEINKTQYKLIHTATTPNNKTQQAACTSIYRKALYLPYFFAMVRAGTH